MWRKLVTCELCRTLARGRESVSSKSVLLGELWKKEPKNRPMRVNRKRRDPGLPAFCVFFRSLHDLHQLRISLKTLWFELSNSGSLLGLPRTPEILIYELSDSLVDSSRRVNSPVPIGPATATPVTKVVSAHHHCDNRDPCDTVR